MSRRDKFHDAVRHALEKEGWIITHDPLPLKIGNLKLEVDLGAEKLIGAQKDNQKIAVEVKSFLKTSKSQSFIMRLGSFPIQSCTSTARTRSHSLFSCTRLYSRSFIWGSFDSKFTSTVPD
jgi:hypothetical protein